LISETPGAIDVSSRLPSGRSGNHVDPGWFISAGPGIVTGTWAESPSILDLVPTVFRWLDAEPSPKFRGRPSMPSIRDATEQR
jgi:hypothetical protein